VPAEGRPLRFRVDIEAPRPYEQMLRERLPLMRWQASEQVTLPVLRRLVQEARQQVQEALATEGYFSAEVRADLDTQQQPAIVRLEVDPGPRTRVTGVDLDFKGAALGDPEGQERIEAIRKNWDLRVGEPFRDPAWDLAKREALARLQRGRYAAARIAESEARVVPEQRAAQLRLTLESGPIFHAGPVRISGLKRYPPEVVRNFNPLRYGEPYDEIKLELYQRRLLETGYFNAVHFAVEPDVSLAAAAPLNIELIEAPSQRVDLGVSYSTDVQLGLKVDYHNVDLLDRALRFRTLLDLNEKEQLLRVSVDTPPRPGGIWHTYTAAVERSDVSGLISREAMVEVARNWGLEAVPSRLFVSGHIEKRDIAGFGEEDAHALFIGYRKTYRTTDALLNPRTGLIGTVEVGASVPEISSRTFGRVRGLLNWLVPFGAQNDLLVRAEVGVVFAQGRTGIPSSFLFRTGGDQSVRGYAFESLGVPLGDATVGGRYLTVASAEYTRWFTDTLGAAAFVDVGDAFDALNAIELAAGVGVGVRYRSPVGPVRADIAYGERSGSIRLHFSVGYTF
jgi:translocation and assembly module TamA